MPSESTHANCLDIALPGYALSDQLGVGGYGEVWRATAPGGLAKAVKFVFGHYSEKRATRELRALEKIKEVRHPFLLSLERIEVLEDRLVIITELAEGSLKDRFDQCQAQGMPGIAREELLGYLRDAADALDFLSRVHSLQHLDVKPENLLLLAGHVKVADFGLVKDVANSQASLVGGLTPLYAAPEVFQGRPTSFSDQYSLAVLYQEMLTGTPPFDGVTAAELTMQHLKDEPNLESLPTADRYILARALAKDVERRFASCSEFVAALTTGGSDWHRTSKQETPATAADPAVVAKAKPRRRGPVTEVFDDDGAGSLNPSIMLPTPARPSVESTVLPPPSIDNHPFTASPALVIGVGGVGGNVLCELRRQLASSLGNCRRAPALGTLLLDCDAKAILAATRSDRPGALRPDETMSLSLRRPQDYRDRSQNLGQWLGRRWLYNIPKSLNTEGLRPLGRLALIDHLMQTLQRIRLAATTVASSESLASTAEATGYEYRGDALRIYVVAAASGGLGSGAALDLGYALRTVLEKLPFIETTTMGIFTHSLGSDQRSSELARVNAYSWLTELLHAMRPDFAYPGDPSGVLPAFAAGVAPYDHTYLVQLANGLDANEFRAAARQVADYVLLDTVTPTQLALDASRSAKPREPMIGGLRSFGVRPIASTTSERIAEAASRVVQRVVKQWHGKKPSQEVVRDSAEGESGKVEAVPSAAAQQIAAELELDVANLAAAAGRELEAFLGAPLDQAYLGALADLADRGDAVTLRAALETAGEFFAPPKASSSRQTTYLGERPLVQVMAATASKQCVELRQRLLGMLDAPHQRLAGAEAAVTTLRDLLQAIRRDASDREAETLRDIRLTADRLGVLEPLGGDVTADPEQMAPLFAYVRLRFDGAVAHAVGAIVDALIATLKEVSSELREAGRRLDALTRHAASAVSEAAAERLHAKGNDASADHVDQLVKSRLAELAKAADRGVQERWVEPAGGLAAALVDEPRVRAALFASLEEEAAAVVQKYLSQKCVDHILEQGRQPSGESVAGVAAADPALLAYGGGVQRLAIVPDTGNETMPVEQLSDCLGGVGVVVGRHVDYLYCCEAQQIPAAAWALDAIEKRRDYAAFARRVHTRSDIAWSPLHENEAASDAASGLPAARTVDVGPATPV